MAAFPLVASAERRADFLISDPLLNFEYGLFRDVTAGPAPVSLDALRSLRVAGIQGYDYWPELDAAVGKYVQFNTSEAAFAALARGEVDIVAEGTVAGNTILADPGFAVDAARFARIDAPWASSQQSLHAMVARTSAGEEFLQEFNASLELHKSTPAYREAVQALSDAPTPDRVRLVGSGSLVSVHLEGDEVLRVPRGCEGVVVAWPEQLDEDASAKLKLTSGPARGRLGHVAIKDLEVLP